MQFLQPPVPVKPWDEVFDASEEGPACPQLNYTINSTMSEDCLRLNVYTTKVTIKRYHPIFSMFKRFYYFWDIFRGLH